MTNTRCCVCNAATAKPCSSCKSAYFCTVACQKDGWRSHKLLCKTFAGFDVPRPMPSATLALYFSILPLGVKGKLPELIWIGQGDDGHRLRVEKKPDGTLARTNCLEVEDNNPPPGEFDIAVNYVTEETFGYPVTIYCRKQMHFDYSRANISLIETTKGNIQYLWAGPLVIFAKRGFRSDCCQDITLADFRTLLDFCKVYARSGLAAGLNANFLMEIEITNPTLFKAMLRRESGGQTFKAVEITCEADRQFLKVEKFLPVDITIVHPIFDDINQEYCQPTEITKMIDLPLRLRRILPDERWRTLDFGVEAYTNSAAEYLAIDADTTSSKWGFHDFGIGAEAKCTAVFSWFEQTRRTSHLTKSKL